MKYISLLALIFTFGCSTNPSKYRESTGKDGYTDLFKDPNLKVATFEGNSATKKDQAQLLAKFRAIEVCTEQNKKYAHILTMKDKSYDKEISQTTTTSPTYYYGMAPYYGRYGAYGTGVSMYGAYGPVSTQTSNETYTYPKFEVYYECEDTALDARMSFSVLSESQMEKFVKDVKGAVQVAEILPDSPNKNTFKVGDIIINANGTRVATVEELYHAYKNTIGDRFTLEFIREGVKKKADVKFLDVTEMVAQSQKEIIKEACKIAGINDVRKLCK